jgi:hypothetical protein
VTQHRGLDLERWSGFTPDQRLLMVANEVHRLRHVLGSPHLGSLRRGYERVLRLTDLTVQATDRRGLRRELLRWRDLVAALYLAPEPDPEGHVRLERALLLLSPAGARQLRALEGRAAPQAT